MFLNTFNAGASFDFARDHGISCGKPAIEAELSYLPGLNCNDIRVEETGQFIVLEGSVQSAGDLARVTRLANEIAGADRVICQLAIVSVAKKPSPIFIA